ncbi:MAG: hypothetical protein GTO13_22855 [Proteobacteria bacterium]|nr:hypothetical protein [Pseudomonadota bacterium]
MVGTFGAIWGLAGVFLILVIPIYRLTIIAVEAFSYEFLWYHWVGLVLNTLFLAHVEGYRGFQKGFSPRVAVRAKYLKDHPNALYALLGPFFCMSYFFAPTKRKVFMISLTVGIIILILLIRLLSQPWRGIVDLGVVIGLTWGLISLFIFSLRAFTSEKFHYSPEVPDKEKT